jgi:hypothetical protein
MAGTGNVKFELLVAETVAAAFGDSSDVFKASMLLDFNAASIGAPVVYANKLPLVAGTLTLSLAALAQSGGRSALDLTNKAIFLYAIKNLGANSMTFIEAAANGYPMFTVTTGTVLRAGGVMFQHAPAGFGTVAAADLGITITGTLVQEFQIVLIAGTPPA